MTHKDLVTKIYNTASEKEAVEECEHQSSDRFPWGDKNDTDVSHPAHYQSSGGLEVIDAIQAFTEDLNGMEAVDTANVIKYICRWKKKNGVQDLKKASWYLNHLIHHLEKENTQ